MSAMNKN